MVKVYYISGRFGDESFIKACNRRWRATRRKRRRATRERCPFCLTWITRRSLTMIEDHWCMKAYHSALDRHIRNLQAGLGLPEE